MTETETQERDESQTVTVDVNVARPRIEALANVVDEALLIAESGQFTLLNRDPANVAIGKVWFDVDPVSGEGPEGRRGINVKALADALSEGHTWVELELRDGGLVVRGPDIGEAGVRTFDTDLIPDDPEEGVETCEDYDYDHDLTVDGYRFRGVVGGIAGVSFLLRFHRRESFLDVWGNGGITDETEWPHEWGFWVEPGEPGEPSYYSGDYLGDIAPGMPFDEPVNVRFSEDFPMRIATDGMRFYLAPRTLPEDKKAELEADIDD